MPQLPFQAWWTAWLKAQGISNRVAATKLNVATTTTHGYKHGIFTPSPAIQERLSALSGTPIEELAHLVWLQDRQRRQERAAGSHYSTRARSRAA